MSCLFSGLLLMATIKKEPLWYFRFWLLLTAIALISDVKWIAFDLLVCSLNSGLSFAIISVLVNCISLWLVDSYHRNLKHDKTTQDLLKFRRSHVTSDSFESLEYDRQNTIYV